MCQGHVCYALARNPSPVPALLVSVLFVLARLLGILADIRLVGLYDDLNRQDAKTSGHCLRPIRISSLQIRDRNQHLFERVLRIYVARVDDEGTKGPWTN